MRLLPLWVLSAVLAGVLGLELAQPASLATEPVGQAHPARGRHSAAATGVDDDALEVLADTILARPLLTPSRRGQDAPAEDLSDNDAEVPRLTGVLLGPNGHRAIFAPAKGHPLVLTEGDALGPYTITAIAPNTVTLTGSEGDRLIRPSYAKGPLPGGAARKAPSP